MKRLGMTLMVLGAVILVGMVPLGMLYLMADSYRRGAYAFTAAFGAWIIVFVGFCLRTIDAWWNDSCLW